VPHLILPPAGPPGPALPHSGFLACCLWEKRDNRRDLPIQDLLFLALRQGRVHNRRSLLVSLFSKLLLRVRNKPAVPGDFFL
jgi:hypothetical protein